MKKVGRYVVISEMGRGAMGIVYRASDPTIDREVALKVVSLNVSTDQEASSPKEMFMREVRAAGRLAHPSIVTIHDAFDDQENQTSCIVMELVPGMTLEKILESGRTLTLDQSLSLAHQVAEALDYAHRNQVIHRDLKPANILVTEDGRAKITDFGIAKILAREGAARTVGVMGTPSYMSPEQVRGGDIDARTDIFSLGIIFYSMLTGKKPFAGNTAAVMFKIVYEEPPAPSTLNPELTPAHDYVVSRCLAKDRNKRYSSARELLGDLDDLQFDRAPRSQIATPAPGAAPPAAPGTQPLDRTMAMPIPGLTKAAPQQPAQQQLPPAPPSAPPKPMAAQPPKPAAPPVTPAVTERPVTAPPANQTMTMPISGLMKGMSQAQPPRAVSAPPRPPKVAGPPTAKPAPHAGGQPLTGQTLPMRVPDLSASGLLPPPTIPPSPSIPVEPTLGDQTLPMRVPDLSAAAPQKPSSPQAEHKPPQPAVTPLANRTLPMQVPSLSEAPVAAGPPVATPAAAAPAAVPAPTFQPIIEQAQEPANPSEAVVPAPKSKLIPALVGVVAVVLLAGAGLIFWGIRRGPSQPPQPPQVATVQTLPETTPPTPVPATVETPAPPPAIAAAAPAPPAKATPETVKRTVAHKPKEAATPHPAAPAPPPPQPAPVAAAPVVQPAPPTPSQEDLAKAEAARLAKMARIVKVLCNFGLKEATIYFSAGGTTLFEAPLKGKKAKEKALGIKGSYQGTLSQTITVPGGTSEVTVRVISKDGGTDWSKAIKMPPPGGFVPTLDVEVDSDHLSPNWQASSGTN